MGAGASMLGVSAADAAATGDLSECGELCEGSLTGEADGRGGASTGGTFDAPTVGPTFDSCDTAEAT
jgi:hypothetical protein